MLDLRAQTQFADATAAMMRTCAIAATHALARSVTQGLSFWSDVARAANQAREPAWRPASPTIPLGIFPALSPAYWMAVAQMSPQINPWSAWSWGSRSSGGMRRASSPAPPPDAGFASYRSAGGHASAQVVIAPGE